MKHSLLALGLLLTIIFHAQQRSAASRAKFGQEASFRRFYLGLEAGLFFKTATQLEPAFTSLKPKKEVNPTAALVLGYRLTPCVALELHLQDIPVTSGFDYAHTTASGGYTGFGRAYTHEYVYVPVLGV